MANSLLFFALSLLLLLLISTPIASATQKPKFIKSQKPLSKNHEQQMKLSHLRLYFHDILSGRNPTAVTVATGPTTNTSATSFGLVNMIDDPLTVGPAADSKLVGRAQGLYAAASQESLALMMAMNFVFVEGKYNGSTITIMGRNPAVKGAKEMPVVGGSGLFRFASGYVEARTVSWDPKTGDACVRYDCYVKHY